MDHANNHVYTASSAHYAKPTAYLDHNILSLAVKNGLTEPISKLGNDFQVIYSDETLKEIQKSLGYENRFIDVLQAFDAKYFVHAPQISDWNQEGLTFLDWSPQTAYEKSIEAPPLLRDISRALETVSFKIMHSQFLVNDNLLSTVNRLAEKFTSAAKFVIEINRESSSDIQKLEHEIPPFREDILRIHQELMELLEAPTGNPDTVMKLRALIETSPVELNNIVPPNVIQKIWEKITSRHKTENGSVTIDQFFLQTPNQTMQSRIMSAFLTLNICGYNSDKLDKTKENRASLSDMWHACNASFADVFITTDKRLSAKTKAVYEYLGLRTTVQLVTPESLTTNT